jgi:hypothetical protein
MIRGYNGRVYSQSNAGRSIEKIHPNNIVRFELDCDEGSVRCFIDGADQGIVYEGLKGKVTSTSVPAASHNVLFLQEKKFSRQCVVMGPVALHRSTPCKCCPAWLLQLPMVASR